MNAQPAFLSKPLKELSTGEWESLCDGCGLCCQIRVQDEDTGEITLSNVACRYLDLCTHRCSDYVNRQRNVDDCIKVTPENVYELDWLPVTCGYRLAAMGEPLPDWHPLICGDPARVHDEEDGISMLGCLISEDEADWDDEEESTLSRLKSHLLGLRLRWFRRGE